MRALKFPRILLLAAAIVGAANPCIPAQPGFGAGGRGAGAGMQGMRPAAVPLHSGIKLRRYTFDPTGEQLDYAIFVPRKLDRSKPAPLVIALHAANAAPAAIVNPLAAAAEKHRYIIVAPMGYGPVSWFGFERRLASQQERDISRLSEIDVMSVLAMVRAEFDIDPGRIYVAGASMGGVGAVHLASKYKDLWAGVAAISPAITENVPDEFSSYATTPLIVLHGDQDSSVPVALVRGWVAGLKARQVPGEYREYRGGTHLSVVQQAGERVLAFFDQHPKTSAAP